MGYLYEGIVTVNFVDDNLDEETYPFTTNNMSRFIDDFKEDETVSSVVIVMSFPEHYKK